MANTQFGTPASQTHTHTNHRLHTVGEYFSAKSCRSGQQIKLVFRTRSRTRRVVLIIQLGTRKHVARRNCNSVTERACHSPALGWLVIYPGNTGSALNSEYSARELRATDRPPRTRVHNIRLCCVAYIALTANLFHITIIVCSRQSVRGGRWSVVEDS